MSSKNKSTTARANGAKSRGPVTPAGRARSSQNATRHGLATRTAALPPASVVLPDESRADFQRLLDSYLDQFSPAGPVEVELVEAMVSARWRLRRIAEIETAMLGNEIALQTERIDDEFAQLDLAPEPIDRVAYVFKHLAYGQSLSLLIRYEGALTRSYSRAFKQLQILQSARARVQPNEPKPAASPQITAPPRPQNPHRTPAKPGPPPATCDNEGLPTPKCPTPPSVTSLSLRT
jgi:hypothetical protein